MATCRSSSAASRRRGAHKEIEFAAVWRAQSGAFANTAPKSFRDDTCIGPLVFY